MPLVYSLVIVVGLMLSACSSSERGRREAFDSLYAKGEYRQALSLNADEQQGESELIALLQRGLAHRELGEYEQSNRFLDAAEDIIKSRASEDILLKNVGATLYNDTILDYRAKEYEAAMLNTYKGLNYWQLGRHDAARVEFNRAIDRQRRAKERFSTELATAKERLKEYRYKEGHNSAQEILDRPEVEEALYWRYKSIEAYKVYPDFINPAVSYMAALFFISEGDYRKASQLLKQAYGMNSDNSVVRDDFAHVEAVLDNLHPQRDPAVWVVAELGMASPLKEFRIHIPIFLFSDRVFYTGIVLPEFDIDSAPVPTICSGDQPSQSLASIDRVAQTEFKKRYPAIVGRAVLGAVIKTAAQYFASGKMGEFGGFTMALYQLSTSVADTRSWRSLPRSIQLMRVAAPADGALKLEDCSGKVLTIAVPSDKNSVIFLRKPSPEAGMSYSTVSF